MGGKSRQKNEPKHIRLYASIMATEAWQHLSGNAVKVLLALVGRDNGTRNGAIGFSNRDAAVASGVSGRTAWRCLVELQDKGFIACTQKGAFNRKVLHATLWRYTWAPWPKGKPAAPTRDFENWRCMEIHGCKICTCPVVVSDEPSGNMTLSDAEFAPDGSEMPDVSVRFQSENIASLILHQGDSAAFSETGRRKQANPPSWALSAFPADDLAYLRRLTAEHLAAGEAGSQSRLAERIGCPAGTFSKFINGRNLPEQYRAALADAIKGARHAA